MLNMKMKMMTMMSKILMISKMSILSKMTQMAKMIFTKTHLMNHQESKQKMIATVKVILKVIVKLLVLRKAKIKIPKKSKK